MNPLCNLRYQQIHLNEEVLYSGEGDKPYESYIQVFDSFVLVCMRGSC